MLRAVQLAMPIVWVPAQLRPLCGGAARLDLPGSTLGELLRAVDEACPGFLGRVAENGQIRPEIAIAIDGEVSGHDLHEPLSPRSEVSILPAISGG